MVAAEKGSRSVGATVGELETLAAGAFLVVALNRRNGETLLQPPANLAINEGDGVAIVGRSAGPTVASVFARPAVSRGRPPPELRSAVFVPSGQKNQKILLFYRIMSYDG